MERVPEWAKPRGDRQGAATSREQRTAPTPLKTPHRAEELRIQELEFRKRRALRAIPDSDFWILDSQKFTVG
jgi:hypothetical protein